MFREETNTYESTRKKHKLFSHKMKFANVKLDTCKSSKMWILVILTVLSFIFSAIFFFKSSYFAINDFNPERQDPYTNIDLVYKAVDKYVYQNIFSFNKSAYIEDIVEFQPNIKNVEVIKTFPRSITTKVYSYAPIYKTEFDWKGYLILENGSFVPYDIEKEELPLINIKNLNLDYTGRLSYVKILNKDDLLKINYLLSWVDLIAPDIEISEINYFVTNKELHIKWDETYFIFDLVWDLRDKMLAFEIFYNENITWDETYVDLRIKDRFDICPRMPENMYENLNDLKKSCLENLKQIYEYNF